MINKNNLEHNLLNSDVELLFFFFGINDPTCVTVNQTDFVKKGSSVMM